MDRVAGQSSESGYGYPESGGDRSGARISFGNLHPRLPSAIFFRQFPSCGHGDPTRRPDRRYPRSEISNLRFEVLLPPVRHRKLPRARVLPTNPTFAILQNMRGRPILALSFLALFSAAGTARADEIRLKDGSKIIGTIVGFENDSFRVETSYGFALVQKDKVADISIVATKKDSEPKPKVSPSPAAPPAAESTSVVPAVAKEPAPSAIGPMRAPVNSAAMPPASAEMAAPKIKSVAASAAPPVAPPLPPPAPDPVVIRDEIRGNQYVNMTYGFQMFKPPSWELIPAARKALPDAVAAMGTYDQTTMLVIGRELGKDTLDAHAATTEKALREVYENYRLISNRHVSVAGLPAVEQRSRGTADGRDWSVILLTVFKGADAFTLLGMTYADSDLIQVQENVISKAINSLTFSTNP